jgi:hypothetical protein
VKLHSPSSQRNLKAFLAEVINQLGETSSITYCPPPTWISLLIFLIIMLEEAIGRCRFYQSRAWLQVS